MKSLLWVEDSLIKELQLLDEVEEISQDQINKVISKFNDEVEMLSENIDSNVLEIRAKAQKVKETYQRVVDEECEAINMLWENLDAVRYKAKQKLENTYLEVGKLKSEVEKVNKLFDNIYNCDYKLERTMEIVRMIASMSEKEKELLQKMLG